MNFQNSKLLIKLGSLLSTGRLMGTKRVSALIGKKIKKAVISSKFPKYFGIKKINTPLKRIFKKSGVKTKEGK